MIFLDNLGGLKRGRFWINQLPFRLEPSARSLVDSFDHYNSLFIPAFRICCEIALLPREISNYGLLGLEFSPLEGHSVQYEIFYLENNRVLLEDNIAMRSEQVYIGIPKEFAIAIKDVMEKLNGSEIPVGKYSFITSAYGAVGSSKVIFSKLTSILLKLACANPNVLNGETTKLLIADEIKRPFK